MPKVIEGLENKILNCSKKILLEQGLGALTIRTVAKECGVAVGTVYNYYGSKDRLVAGVMLEDWRVMVRQSECCVHEAKSIAEGLRAICSGIHDFSRLYRGVWAQDTHPLNSEYHNRLIRQLSGEIWTLIERFSQKHEEAVPEFIAENLLRLALRGMDAYEKEEFLLLRAVGI